MVLETFSWWTRYQSRNGNKGREEAYFLGKKYRRKKTDHLRRRCGGAESKLRFGSARLTGCGLPWGRSVGLEDDELSCELLYHLYKWRRKDLSHKNWLWELVSHAITVFRANNNFGRKWVLNDFSMPINPGWLLMTLKWSSKCQWSLPIHLWLWWLQLKLTWE